MPTFLRLVNTQILRYFLR